MKKKIIAALAASAMVVGLAACGSDDDNAATDTTMAATDTTMAAETAGNIVEVAAANGSFGFLLEAATLAGLDTALAGEGPLTVLAPTDAAFEALAAQVIGEGATLEQLKEQLAKDIDGLTAVLQAHVISGKVMAADTAALDGMKADTLGGEKLTVSSKDGAVSFTVGKAVANVTTADVEASNGVIHVIDAVLLPLSMQD
jgi:hypothetical protein